MLCARDRASRGARSLPLPNRPDITTSAAVADTPAAALARWGTYPTRDMVARVARFPKIRTVPAVGSSAPTRVRTSVDLPDPLPPITATTSPGAHRNATPCSISVPPSVTRIPSAVMAAAPERVDGAPSEAVAGEVSGSGTVEGTLQAIKIAVHDAEVVVISGDAFEWVQHRGVNSRIGSERFGHGRAH